MKKMTVMIAVFLTMIMTLSGCNAPAAENTSEIKAAEIEKPVKSEGSSSTEMTIEEKYMGGLAAFLTEQLDLNHYEKEIENTGLQIIPEGERTESQKKGDLGLSCIYLRNELNLNVLSEQERRILEENELYKDDTYNGDILDVVFNTFPEVIIPEGARKDDMTYYDNSVFGSDKPDFISADSMVLRIAVSEKYDDDGNRMDLAGTETRRAALNELISDMQEQLTGLLGEVPVVVQGDPIR